MMYHNDDNIKHFLTLWKKWLHIIFITTLNILISLNVYNLSFYINKFDILDRILNKF